MTANLRNMNNNLVVLTQFLGRRQAIISFSAGILLIGYIRINFSEIISDKSYVSIKGNALQNVVYGMMTICLDLNL